MAAWTANIVGIGGEGNSTKPGRTIGTGADNVDALLNQPSFREIIKPDLYDRYIINAQQAEGLICHVFIPKDVAVAASDTFTLTVVAAA